MSRDYPVPVGFLPIFDALDRARLEYDGDSRARFHGLLISGRLLAWCSDAAATITAIDPSFWTGEHARRALDNNEVRTGPSSISSAVKGRPVFKEIDLDNILPTFAQRMRAAADERQAKRILPAEPQGKPDRGGSKALYDEIGFMIEAFRLVYEGNEPTSQADLIRQALDAYQQKGLKGGTPSAEWPKVLVRRMWNELGLERRASPSKRNR